MKKASTNLMGLLLVVVIIATVIIGGYLDTHYTRKATVTEIENDLIICVDSTGNEWSFYGDSYSIGDEITLVMDNNTTENTIKDDKIVDVK